MRRGVVQFGLPAGVLLLGLGLSGAEASVNKPIPPESLGIRSAVTPAAMCGSRSCRTSFYIPGPPEVCFERGLNYCGSSRGWGGPPPWAGYGFQGGGPGRIDCRELRRACLFRDELGERGQGNCRRYRELCRGGESFDDDRSRGGRFGGDRF